VSHHQACCCGQTGPECPGICPCVANTYSVTWNGSVSIGLNPCDCGTSRYYGAVTLNDGVTRSLVNAVPPAYSCVAGASFTDSYTATYYNSNCIAAAPGGGFSPCLSNAAITATIFGGYQLFKPDRAPQVCTWRCYVDLGFGIQAAGFPISFYRLQLLYEKPYVAGPAGCAAPGALPYVGAQFVHPTFGVSPTVPAVGQCVYTTETVCDVLRATGRISAILPGSLVIS